MGNGGKLHVIPKERAAKPRDSLDEINRALGTQLSHADRDAWTEAIRIANQLVSGIWVPLNDLIVTDFNTDSLPFDSFSGYT